MAKDHTYKGVSYTRKAGSKKPKKGGRPMPKRGGKK